MQTNNRSKHSSLANSSLKMHCKNVIPNNHRYKHIPIVPILILLILLITTTSQSLYSQYVYKQVNNALKELKKSNKAVRFVPSVNYDTVFITYFKNKKEMAKTRENSQYTKGTTGISYWKLDSTGFVSEEWLLYTTAKQEVDIEKLYEIESDQIMRFDDLPSHIAESGVFLTNNNFYFYMIQEGRKKLIVQTIQADFAF